MDAKTLLAVVVLIAFKARTNSVSGNSAQTFKVKDFSSWSPRIKTSYQIIEDVESVLFCYSVCASDRGCKGAVWKGTTCTLFSMSVLELSKPGDSSQTVGFLRPGTLVLQFADTGDLSYTASQSLCSSLGGVMARRADIQRIYQNGISVCGCGWVVEGYGVYPMTYSSGSCGNTIGLIDCDDNDTTRAWCTFLP